MTSETAAPTTTTTATLTYGHTTLEMPVVSSTDGNPGLDISRLQAATGLVTLDNGYKNSAAATSAITFLDGERGILRYRGYPIEQLADGSSFLEVAYLLIFGELPTADQLRAWIDEIT